MRPRRTPSISFPATRGRSVCAVAVEPNAVDSPPLARRPGFRATALFTLTALFTPPSAGAMMLELLSGSTPRWNQAKGHLEDAVLSQPLAPPTPLPPTDLGHAWALAVALTSHDPSRRPTAHAALQSPLFAPLTQHDALAPLAAAATPPALRAATPPPPLEPPLVPGVPPVTADAAAVAAAADPFGALMPPMGGGGAGGGLDDTPDWLQSAAVDVGVPPLPPPPPAATVCALPVVEVVTFAAGDAADAPAAAARLVHAVLDAAASLQSPAVEIKHTATTATAVEQRPASELLHRFLHAAADGATPPGARLLESTEHGRTYLPIAPSSQLADPSSQLTDSGAQPTEAYERLGRLLGVAAVQGLGVYVYVWHVTRAWHVARGTWHMDLHMHMHRCGPADPRLVLLLRYRPRRCYGVSSCTRAGRPVWRRRSPRSRSSWQVRPACCPASMPLPMHCAPAASSLLRCHRALPRPASPLHPFELPLRLLSPRPRPIVTPAVPVPPPRRSSAASTRTPPPRSAARWRSAAAASVRKVVAARAPSARKTHGTRQCNG